MSKLALLILLIIGVMTMTSENIYAQKLFYSPKVGFLYKYVSEVCAVNPLFGADTVLYCTSLVKGDTVPVIISKDENDVVEHIGYCFLPDSIRTTDITIIQFVEREILTILSARNVMTALRSDYENGLIILLDSIPIDPNMLQDKKKLSSLLKDCRETVINRTNNDYEVTILCFNGRKLTFTFPADSKLISGMDKKEQENKLAFQLQNHVAKRNDSLIPLPDIDYLQLLQDSTYQECIYIEKGSEYKIPQINNDLFYLGNDSIFSLVSDTSMVSWTFSNAMLAPTDKHYTIDVIHKMYGYVVLEYTIDSRDFNDFFSHGYIRYFGIETFEPENLSGTLILYNRDEEYIHLAYVTTTLDDLINGGKMTMELYSNIPQHNIKAQYEERKKEQ